MTPKATMNDSGYAQAAVTKGSGKRLDNVNIKTSKNGGYILTESYRRTNEGKARMTTPDWLPDEPPMTFESFDAMVGALRKCFGVKAKG